jgi:hypothetical protein
MSATAGIRRNRRTHIHSFAVDVRNDCSFMLRAAIWEVALAKSAIPREMSGEEGLLLIIRNERRIKVADLAELFGALAKDYRRISNGGELIVAKVSEGSLIALFHDAAGFFTDANSLIVFGKTIVGLTKIALGASAGASKLLKGRRAGTQTVKSLAKLAFATDGEVEMKYKRSLFGGEEFHLKLNSKEAEQIQNIASTKHSQLPVMKEKQNLLGAGPARLMSDELVRLSKGDDGQTPADVRALIDAIVGTLATHDPDYVFEIITELEAEGQFAVAQLLRDALERSKANHKPNPPLLT